ncbi:hypothetical protein [Echinicola soli]|uniref:hypothetical protein n=1 Tax=Echinicola soli TaxID=2591634 RepID=UPI00143D3510|nr:hypothetical protein [Echinicola soli]
METLALHQKYGVIRFLGIKPGQTHLPGNSKINGSMNGRPECLILKGWTADH